VVDTPGCSQPGEGDKAAANCADGPDVSPLEDVGRCNPTSAESGNGRADLPSPSRGSGRGPSMEGGAVAMDQTSREALSHNKAAKDHTRETAL
jgi:hypothetical protein